MPASHAGHCQTRQTTYCFSTFLCSPFHKFGSALEFLYRLHHVIVYMHVISCVKYLIALFSLVHNFHLIASIKEGVPSVFNSNNSASHHSLLKTDPIYTCFLYAEYIGHHGGLHILTVPLYLFQSEPCFMSLVHEISDRAGT